MKRKSIFRGAAIGVILMMTLFLSTGFIDKYQGIVRKLATIEAVLDEYYVGELDSYKLQEGIYKGFIAGVGDNYTTYYTQKEYDAFKEETSGVYNGIGIQMSLETEDNSVYISQVFEGSPAQEAGLLQNDKIINVAGKNISGDDFSEIATLVAGGEKGSYVDITVYRSSEDKEYTFSVRRDNINYPTVNFKMVDNDLAYIQITKFEDLTHKQFKEALEKSKTHNAKGIVLDLRNNPGGLLRIAKDIVDELIPGGIIVSTKDKNGQGTQYYADDKYTDIPMVVLINGSSASASEVVAGALKDCNRAKLIGETSFGKGVVQTVVPLSDGSAIKLTTSQYFTPSGICIQGIGIEPDIKAELSVDKMLRGNKLEEADDDQLQAAIKALKEEIGE